MCILYSYLYTYKHIYTQEINLCLRNNDLNQNERREEQRNASLVSVSVCALIVDFMARQIYQYPDTIRLSHLYWYRSLCSLLFANIKTVKRCNDVVWPVEVI